MAQYWNCKVDEEALCRAGTQLGTLGPCEGRGRREPRNVAEREGRRNALCQDWPTWGLRGEITWGCLFSALHALLLQPRDTARSACPCHFRSQNSAHCPPTFGAGVTHARWENASFQDPSSSPWESTTIRDVPESTHIWPWGWGGVRTVEWVHSHN